MGIAKCLFKSVKGLYHTAKGMIVLYAIAFTSQAIKLVDETIRKNMPAAAIIRDDFIYMSNHYVGVAYDRFCGGNKEFGEFEKVLSEYHTISVLEEQRFLIKSKLEEMVAPKIK